MSVVSGYRKSDVLIGQSTQHLLIGVLVLALGVLAWSHFVTFPLGERMPAAIETGDTVVMQRAMPLIFLELAGFFGIFTCMILMRFGV